MWRHNGWEEGTSQRPGSRVAVVGLGNLIILVAIDTVCHWSDFAQATQSSRGSV